MAFVSTISKDHQGYLARGGVGFIIGEGTLNYGPEQIIESYYTAIFDADFSLASTYST